MNRLAIFALAFVAALPLTQTVWAAPDATADDLSLWRSDLDDGESCLANQPHSESRFTHGFFEETCRSNKPSALRTFGMLTESSSHRKELDRLYQRHLTIPCDSTKIIHRFQGKLTLFITIENSGAVSEATIVSSTTHCPAFDEAVRQNVKSWRYPQANGTSNTHMVWKFSKYPPPGSYAEGSTYGERLGN